LKYNEAMNALKRFLILAILSHLFFSANGQLLSELHKLYHPAYYYKNQADTSTFEPWNKFTPGQTNYSFEVGSSFSSYGGGISSSYISPMVSFMATDRLHIVAGGKFSYANIGNTPILNSQFDLGDGPGIGNPTEAFAYGKFQVNDKLSVFGMGAFGKNQLYMSPFQAGIGTTDYQQFSFGMDYKISEKTSIGASIGFVNGPAWGMSPFGGHGFRSLHTNPFFP
jgi:hypothetical protein